MREKENLKYCSIINRRHFERIKGLVEDAVSKGAVISKVALMKVSILLHQPY